MRTKIQFIRIILVIFIFSTIYLVSCNEEEPSEPQTTGMSAEYTLAAVGSSGVSGMATFEELDNGATRITVSLQGTSGGGDHPAHIHVNSALEGGAIALDLSNVVGSTGMSVTEVTELNDGTPISYEELVNYDGHIKVHNSPEDLATVIASGDIGLNMLTGNNVEYALEGVSETSITGSATFYERMNGETIVEIQLSGVSGESDYPSHIHMNSAEEGGGIAISLNNVVGGFSQTNVSSFDEGTAVTYSELLDYDGYINVHNSDDTSILMAQGNIGSNAEAEPVNYGVVNSGMTAYVFNGNGLSDVSNPSLTFQRGRTYTFSVNTTGHPFYIKSEQSTGTSGTYDQGVSNNGATSGAITFEVPMDAPETLFYNCEFHISMTGTITITD